MSMGRGTFHISAVVSLCTDNPVCKILQALSGNESLHRIFLFKEAFELPTTISKVTLVSLLNSI